MAHSDGIEAEAAGGAMPGDEEGGYMRARFDWAPSQRQTSSRCAAKNEIPVPTSAPRGQEQKSLWVLLVLLVSSLLRGEVTRVASAFELECFCEALSDMTNYLCPSSPLGPGI